VTEEHAMALPEEEWEGDEDDDYEDDTLDDEEDDEEANVPLNDKEERLAALLELLDDIDKAEQEADAFKAALTDGTLHVDDAGALAGTALVKAGSAQDAKRTVALVRNRAQKMRLRMESKQRDLANRLAGMTSALEKRMREMQKLVDHAERAIFTINLYLGAGENFELLRDGEPAPAEEAIAVRQTVLFMDEECALRAEDDGIDAREIESFDKWLLEDERNLTQVLPETKGLVCLRPRKKVRDYGDAWLDKMMRRENHRSYFLVKNGQKVWRFWSTYEAQERLMPKEDEFLSYFEERDYVFDHKNPGGGHYETRRLKPGSEKWMQAQDKAKQAELPYRQFFLMLQGLLDRTTLFHPLPGPVSLENPNTWGTVVRIVKDAEKTLSDGKERFAALQDRVNRELDVGMRIVGNFESQQFWDANGSRYKSRDSDGNQRITPKGAEYPRTEDIQTLEGRRHGGFIFRFERHEKNWRRDWREGIDRFEHRATCVVMPHDKFILNIDHPDVTPERLRYHLGSRLDREHYGFMFPAIKAAIAALEEEAATEAPFCLLLTGLISRSVPETTVEEAQAWVPDLVRWWKLKNRHHRALSKDDAKAVRMIVAEAKRRKKAGEYGHGSQEGEHDTVSQILNLIPGAMFIGRRSYGDYVVYSPMNDETVYVQENRWSKDRRKHTVAKWKIPGAAWRSWHCLHKTVLWDNWKHNASPFEHVTDEERVALLDQAWEREVEQWSKPYHSPWDTRHTNPPMAAGLVLLARAWTPGEVGRLYYYPHGVNEHLDHDNRYFVLEDGPDHVKYVEVRWKRTPDRKLHLLAVLDYSDRHTVGFDPEKPPWRAKDYGRQLGQKVFFVNEPAVKAMEGRIKKAKVRAKERDALFNKGYAYRREVDKLWHADVMAKEFTKFLDDFGDPELWEGHKKTLKLPSADHCPFAGAVQRACVELLEKGIDPAGYTLKALIETWRYQYPEAREGEGASYRDYRDAPVVVPAEYEHLVVPDLKEKE
jgi:hypothetical protein